MKQLLGEVAKSYSVDHGRGLSPACDFHQAQICSPVWTQL